MKDMNEFKDAQIEALRAEVLRLNGLLLQVEKIAIKRKEYDPNYDKPLSEINVEL
jgi:hypothetical protein